MLRLPPTTISLTAAELDNFECRCRCRRKLRNRSPHRKHVHQIVDAVGPATPAARHSTMALSGASSAADLMSTDLETSKSASALVGPRTSVNGDACSTRTRRVDQRIEGSNPELPADSIGTVVSTDDTPFGAYMLLRHAGKGEEGDGNENEELDEDSLPYYAEESPERRLSELHSTPSQALRFTVGRLLSRVRSLGARGQGGTPSPCRQDANVPKKSPRVAESDVALEFPKLSVYDDSLPETSQPRSADYLPEYLHQSRVGGMPQAQVPAFEQSQQMQTPSTRPASSRRAGSPAGLTTPGFQGLYGGIENTDDEALYS